MDYELIRICLSKMGLAEYATVIASISAVIAAVSASFSYRLSKKIYDEIKSDEVVVVSKIQHPELKEADHKKSVLYFTIFNKSHRKVSITKLRATDTDGNNIPIKWSTSIDQHGNIENPTGLVGLSDSKEIYIRRNDGESYFITKFFLKNSFQKNEIELIYKL